MSAKIIRLPNGRAINLAAYVSAWRRLKSLSPDTEIDGWDWFPTTAGTVLQEISRGVDDRIMRRGAVRTDWPEPSTARIRRQLERRVTCTCRWCGQDLPAYQPQHARFCDAGCRQAHSD